MEQFAAARACQVHRLVSIGLLGLEGRARIDFCGSIPIPDGPLPVGHVEGGLEPLTDAPLARGIQNLHFEVSFLELELANGEEKLADSLPEDQHTSLSFVDLDIHVAVFHERVVIHVEAVVVVFEEHSKSRQLVAVPRLSDAHAQHLEGATFNFQVPVVTGLGLLELVHHAEFVLLAQLTNERAQADLAKHCKQQQDYGGFGGCCHSCN